MTAPPKYTKVASGDPSEQEIEFEEVDSGSASHTPATSGQPPTETAPAAEGGVEVPSRSSSASEVRAYIVHLLVNKHGVTSEVAHTAACKWTLGRGYDFLDASSRDFDGIFGTDLGPHLYKSTAEDEWIRWNSSDVQFGFGTLYTIGGVAFVVSNLNSAFNALRGSAWAVTIFAMPSLIFMTNAPMHVRDRYEAGIYLTTLAMVLWMAYAVQQLTRG